MTAHRILLYGASNLWLSRRAALTEIRRRFPGYLEIGLANGPGRSYGLRAGNPLLRYEPLHTVDFGFTGPVTGERVAFVTDVGNDIVYSQTPRTILNWVRDLAYRLESEGYSVQVGGVPAESLSLLNPRLFDTFARLYYSHGRMERDLVQRHLEEVQIGIEEMCEERGYGYHRLSPLWYSYDRFHLKGRARRAYWRTLLASFPERMTYDSTWSWQVRQPLFPRRFWMGGRERSGRSTYPNLVPDSLTRVR